jgi:hypothetical protein
MDLKSQTDPNTVIVGDLNTPLSPVDSNPSKRSTKTSESLNNRYV